MMRKLTLIAVLLVAGCGKDPVQQRREDDQAVAAVNAAQNRLPPPKPFRPEPLTVEDLARMDDVGARCILPADPAGPAIPQLVTMGSYGWIKLDGELIRLVADTAGQPGNNRTWSRYTGKELTLRIEPAEARAAPITANGVHRRVRLTVRDAWQRVIFETTVWQACSV
jgi:hypothetical protein